MVEFFAIPEYSRYTLEDGSYLKRLEYSQKEKEDSDPEELAYYGKWEFFSPNGGKICTLFLARNSAKDARTYQNPYGFGYWTLQPKDKSDFSDVTRKELEALINAPTDRKPVAYIEYEDWEILRCLAQDEQGSVWEVRNIGEKFTLTVWTTTKKGCCRPNACLGMDSERPLENILYDIVEKVDGKVLLSGEALELWRDFPFTAILNAAMHKG